MRRAMIISAALAASGLGLAAAQGPATAPAKEGEVVRSKNDAKQTVLSLAAGKLSDGEKQYSRTDFSLSAVLDKAPKVELRFTYRSKSPDLAGCQKTALLADGEMAKFVDAPMYGWNEERVAGAGGEKESVYAHTIEGVIAAKDFTTLTKGKEIKGSFCGLSFTLRPEQQKALKAFADELAKKK
jgi:hypothetical protein